MVRVMEKGKIFIAEDNSMMRDVLHSVISNTLGLEVISKANYEDSVNALDVCAPDVLLALLDFSLPDAPDGEIIDYVLSKNVPVIVFTGHDSHDMRDYIWSKKVVDYVEKGSIASIDYVCYAIRRFQLNDKIKLLVVDDSIVARKYVSELLKVHRYNVFEASSGDEALTIIKREGDIKLVVTDYVMPDMDGFKLATEIRSIFSKEHLAIIGISGVGKHNIAAKFLKSGANDYINKPIITDELYYRVNNNLEQLERVNELEKLNKLKNTFLGMAAHDLRSPLSSIEGFSDLLLTESPELLTGSPKKYASSSQKARETMLNLVNDLLDVVAIESGKLPLARSMASLPALLEERVEICTHLAKKKNIIIHFEKKDMPDVYMDCGLISQVLDNLISNALKFSPFDANIYVAFEVGEKDAMVIVRDEGPGISEEEQKQMFKAFHKLSAKPTNGEASTGLGLSIAKKIIDAHSGKIWVESETGTGASFAFSIPLKNY